MVRPSEVTSEAEIEVEVLLRTNVKLSEDGKRIEESIKRLFPGTTRTAESSSKNELVVRGWGTETLGVLKEQLKTKRTRAVAKRLLERNKRGEVTWMYLNKQALVSGAVALCEREDESPLGPVVLELKSVELPRLIDWLTLGAVLSPEKEPR